MPDEPAKKPGGVLIEDCHMNTFELKLSGYEIPVTMVGSTGNKLSGKAETAEVALARLRVEGFTDLRTAILNSAPTLSREQLTGLLEAMKDWDAGGEARAKSLGKFGQFAAELTGTALGTFLSGLVTSKL